jgi:hypothetical protein
VIFAAQDAPPVLLTPVANGKNLQLENFHYFVWRLWVVVSLTPVANLSPVSTAPALFLAKFAAGAVNTGDAS